MTDPVQNDIDPSDIGPDDVNEWKQIRFDTPEKCLEFYQAFAFRRGFTARIQSQSKYDSRKRKMDQAQYLIYVCNRAGYSSSRKRSPNFEKQGNDKPMQPQYVKQRVRAETRNGCKAVITMKYLEGENKYAILKWCDDHSGHGLLPPHLSYKARYYRKKEIVAEPNDSVEVESMGKNQLKTRREREMRPFEGVSIQEHFRKKAFNNPGFYYDVQYDLEGDVANVFWADQQMKMDYALFGDSVLFDTTYRTNKAYRALGLFVGFNHHHEVCIFGAALLYDETVPSFEWLFNTFRKCMNDTMNDKVPLTMLTDQDPAMAAAMKSAFPETYHALCTRHILHIAKQQLGHHLFMQINDDIRHLMYDVDNPDDFELAWDRMLSTFFPKNDDFDNRTLSRQWMVNLGVQREQWSSVWMGRHFTAGMRNKEASSLINRSVHSFLEPDHELMEFFEHFDRMVDVVREKENAKEFDALDKLPCNLFTRCPIMTRAVEVYTPTMFALFQRERQHSLEYQLQPAPQMDEVSVKSWLVYMTDDATHQRLEERLVIVNDDDSSVSCNCCLYESVGLLCRHILRLMEIMGAMGKTEFRTLLESYILNRWTKAAHSQLLKEASALLLDSQIPSTYAGRYKMMTDVFYRITSVACVDPNVYEDVLREYTCIYNRVRTIGNGSLSSVLVQPQELLTHSSMLTLTPP